MAAVLIVSHKPEASSFIAATLWDAGYTVTTAAGPETVDAAVRGAYAVVIIEILMPEVDGVETILNLRKAGFQGGVIAVSGGGRLLSAGEALNLGKLVGADATLARPFSEQELVDVVSVVLAARTAEA